MKRFLTCLALLAAAGICFALSIIPILGFVSFPLGIILLWMVTQTGPERPVSAGSLRKQQR
jgi:hypothetical protein